MDRFVTRTPTWKTLNYSSMSAKSLSNECTSIKKKPLQQKQLNDIPRLDYNFEKSLPNLLPFHHTNVENFNGNSNDSGLSSASSVSPNRISDDIVGYNACLSKKDLTANNPLGKLSDCVDCPVEKENDPCMTIKDAASSIKRVLDSGLPVQTIFEVKKNINPEVIGTPEKSLPKTINMIMARIQRDLNSPSAASRMKAIKALKSPTKSAYSHFDIPEEEQSLRIPDPPSLQEIMRNIVVYVEVRSGEDNRSAGVRKVIEALGARVSLSLNRETTHVIFKDGLLSTFKKATQMNIPIVSILWIEACKNQRRICDPKDYPISNLDRYENPELYNKIKRVKSMQPDSECNKRIRAKPGGTPKDSTPTHKTGNIKKTSTFICGTPTSSTKKKTDISQFFKKIERPTPSSPSKVNGTTITTESPATLLLNRIQSECYTPLNESKAKTVTQENKNNTTIDSKNSHVRGANMSKYSVDVKKTLNFHQTDDDAEEYTKTTITSNIVVGVKTTIEASPLPKACRRSRRRSLLPDSEIEIATNSMDTMAISVSTPSRTKNRRRSSIHTPKDMSLTTEMSSNVNNIIEPILEESNEVQKEHEKPQKPINGRRTLYAVNTGADQTDLMKSVTNKEPKTPSRKSTRRSTLYKSKSMETTEIPTNVFNRRKTCFKLKSLEQSEFSEISVSNKTAEVNTKNLNLINEVEMSSPAAAKGDNILNRRRTLYEPKTISETNIATPNSTTDNTICVTGNNFQMGKMTSSTLLYENSDNRRKSVSTPPPADVVSGKLLEETEQCATPLIFSSTRQPGNKRRTLFDVSMDIITQRLQCINQSARRSLAPSTPSEELVNTLEDQIITPINAKKSNHLLNSTTTKSSMEKLNECIDDNDGINAATIESNTFPKKRKLFMPNEMLATPPTTPAPSLSANIEFKSSEESDKLVSNSSDNTNGNSVKKRRRTLMPISQPQPKTAVTFKDSTAITPTVRKRRSTLDFEQIQMKSINISEDSASASSAVKISKEQFKSKKTPILVYTNMHQQQIDTIREAIDKLGFFVLESSVTNISTHLVSLEPRRTLNLLRALAQGLWILDYSWIIDSVKAGKWLPEEFYELQNFSRAIEICRSERQAFGSKYKCDLFRNVGAFYVSSNSCPINKENMRELITLCGGQVVNTRQKARYIIGYDNKTFDDKFYLTPYWILDSITQMQLMKFSKYMYPLPNGRSSSSHPLPLERKS